MKLCAFQRDHKRFVEASARFVALSVEDERTTAELVTQKGLTFQVGYDTDTVTISAATGTLVNPQRPYPQATDCVINRLIASVHSPAKLSGNSSQIPLSDWSAI